MTKTTSGFACQECGRKFKTLKVAEKAASKGCPKCGGVDIDLDIPATVKPAEHRALVHPDGSECPDGCDAAPIVNPEAV